MGKQHHSMNAMNATTVPIKSIKSSIVGSSPNRKTLFTRYAKSSKGVICVYVCGFTIVGAFIEKALITNLVNFFYNFRVESKILYTCFQNKIENQFDSNWHLRVDPLFLGLTVFLRCVWFKDETAMKHKELKNAFTLNNKSCKTKKFIDRDDTTLLIGWSYFELYSTFTTV